MKKHPADSLKESVVKWCILVLTCLGFARVILYELQALVR